VLAGRPIPLPYERGAMGPAAAAALAEPHGWLLRVTLPGMVGDRHPAPRRAHRRTSGRNGRGGGNGRLRAVQ
jgi:hypothetical protein